MPEPLDSGDSDVEDEQKDWESRESRDDLVFEKIQAQLEKASSLNTLLSEGPASSAEELEAKTSVKFSSVPYGLQPKAAFEHGRKNTDIIGCKY